MTSILSCSAAFAELMAPFNGASSIGFRDATDLQRSGIPQRLQCHKCPACDAYHDGELKSEFREGSLTLAIRGLGRLPTKLVAGKSNQVETLRSILLHNACVASAIHGMAGQGRAGTRLTRVSHTTMCSFSQVHTHIRSPAQVGAMHGRSVKDDMEGGHIRWHRRTSYSVRSAE